MKAEGLSRTKKDDISEYKQYGYRWKDIIHLEKIFIVYTSGTELESVNESP